MPVRRTATDAYRFVFGSLDRVARAAAVPFVVSLLLAVIGVVVPPTPENAWISLLSFVELFTYAVFAVAWHRALLLEESPPVVPQLGRRQFRFVGKEILLVLVTVGLAGLPAGLVVALASTVTTNDALLSALVVAFVLLGIYILARFSFVFPAISVDERFGLRDSWRTSAGNAWRLIGAYLLTALPFIAATVVISLALPLVFSGTETADATQAPGLSAGVFLYIVVNTLVGYVAAAVTVSVLSIAFQTCTGWVPPDEARGPGAPGTGAERDGDAAWSGQPDRPDRDG
jgi:hypothetical protein